MTLIIKRKFARKHGIGHKRSANHGNRIAPSDDDIRTFLKEHVYNLDQATLAKLDACCEQAVTTYIARLIGLTHQCDEMSERDCQPITQRERTCLPAKAPSTADHAQDHCQARKK